LKETVRRKPDPRKVRQEKKVEQRVGVSFGRGGESREPIQKNTALKWEGGGTKIFGGSNRGILAKSWEWQKLPLKGRVSKINRTSVGVASNSDHTKKHK